MSDVTVAIPVRDGGVLFERTLDALAAQTVVHELLICDSGSSDGSPQLARARGGRLLEIDPDRFNHGGTRNLLMQESSGAYVAFLTQDATPTDPHWLERLLGGFALAVDMGLVYGPHQPRPDAAVPVRLELERWFRALAPDGSPRVDRLAEDERPSGPGETGVPAAALIGPRGFFTNTNSCLARAAWERVPFREVPYAEDRVLAIDMLRAGFAKAYLPDAAVLHSHAYTSSQELRRCFDEWRGLREVYGWREPLAPAHVLSRLRGSLGQARRGLADEGVGSAGRAGALAGLAVRQLASVGGALLGSRADRIPPSLRRRLSLEGRGDFAPLDLASPGSAGE